MNYGRLLARNGAKNGFGSQSIVKRARLWAWQLGHAPKRLLANCGPRYRQSTANVPFATRIFGKPMPRSCRPNDTALVVRKADKPTISSALTTPYANGVAAWYAKRSRSQKSWPIILARCGISFTTIMLDNAPNLLSLHLHDYPVFALIRTNETRR